MEKFKNRIWSLENIKYILGLQNISLIPLASDCDRLKTKWGSINFDFWYKYMWESKKWKWVIIQVPNIYLFILFFVVKPV